MKVDLLISGGCIVTMNDQRQIIDDGALAVAKDQIVALGPTAEIEHTYMADHTIDARGKLVMPGLVNAHTHVPMSLFRGIADDLSLMDWLMNYIFPAEAANVTEDFCRWGTQLSCWEMIRSGTTTFADMYFFEDVIAEATKEAGMRAVLGQGVFDSPSPDSRTAPDGLRRAEALLRKWSQDALIRPAIGTHSAYVCSSETLRQAKQLADTYQTSLLIHLAESQSEGAMLREKYGATPVHYMERINCLDHNVVAAHCVWLTDEEIEILKRRNVGVVHCPQSNMKLANGIAPVPRMLKAGLKLGLGTDAPASNNSLDMFAEMSTAARLHKVATLDPTALTALEAVEMATRGSSRVLNLEQAIGSLEAGKKADIIILTLDEPNEIPLYNVYSHLAYAIKSSNVETSLINGRIVMLERKMLTLDTDQIRRKAQDFKRRVLRSLPH
jgi:5-methylthioadenosine/S-adenosylhomocysteine deaminase